MKLKRLLKKYKKLCNKASKIYEEILSIYEAQYLDGDIQACKQILNSMYGLSVYKYTNCHEEYDGIDNVIYNDTDSIKTNNNLTKSMERINQNSHYGLTNYADTDSIKDSTIYKDFNKKSEV